MRLRIPLIVVLAAVAASGSAADAADTVHLSRYVVRQFDGVAALDLDTLVPLCGDEDGCEVVLSRIEASSPALKRIRLLLEARRWAVAEGGSGDLDDGIGQVFLLLPSVSPVCSLGEVGEFRLVAADSTACRIVFID